MKKSNKSDMTNSKKKKRAINTSFHLKLDNNNKKELNKSPLLHTKI